MGIRCSLELLFEIQLHELGRLIVSPKQARALDVELKTLSCYLLVLLLIAMKRIYMSSHFLDFPQELLGTASMCAPLNFCW